MWFGTQQWKLASSINMNFILQLNAVQLLDSKHGQTANFQDNYWMDQIAYLMNTLL